MNEQLNVVIEYFRNTPGVIFHEKDCLELANLLETMQNRIVNLEKLFLMIRKDYDLLENFRSEEWIEKAKELGFDD